MAHLRRLMWFAVGLIFAAGCNSVFADTRSLYKAVAKLPYGGATAYGGTQLQACKGIHAGVNSWNTGGHCLNSSTGEVFGNWTGPKMESCAAGWVQVGTTGVWECPVNPQAECEAGGGHWGTNHSAGGRFVVQEGCYPNSPSCAEPGGILFTDQSLDARCEPPIEGPCPEDIGDLPYVGNLGGGQCLLGGGAQPEPDPDPEPDPKPEPDQTPPGCASNQQSGTVQGVPVCINKPPPPPTDSTDTKTETKPMPDGGTKETTTTTNTTVNNTTNTTTTTTTVTTVIINPAIK